MDDAEREFYVRCLHIDYTRPSEDPGEIHWRCRARVLFQPDAPYWKRDHCPLHRHEPSEHPLSREEAAEVNRALNRLERSVKMPDVKVDGDGLTDEERQWADERKREMVAQAQQAGVLP